MWSWRISRYVRPRSAAPASRLGRSLRLRTKHRCERLRTARGTGSSAEAAVAPPQVASRILANFADKMPADKRVPDTLAQLGELAKTPEVCTTTSRAARLPVTGSCSVCLPLCGWGTISLPVY